MAGTRRRAVSRDEARRLLAAGLQSCSHCQPDTQAAHPRLTCPLKLFEVGETEAMQAYGWSRTARSARPAGGAGGRALA
ncbi:DUF6233 domain-containing protein [Streptomyces sp. NPDC002088]|uniref:DUF6233 domain-containing protein n=1 Tax=Streptomyces sp. NPDC002088 TaxID=3154665 RepID=UPI00331FA2BA